MKSIIAALLVLIFGATENPAYIEQNTDAAENRQVAIQQTELERQYQSEHQLGLAYEMNGKIVPVKDYTEIEENFKVQLAELGYSNFKIVDASEVTYDMLWNRMETGQTIVERIIGFCTNYPEKYDGHVMNMNDSDGGGYYLSYKGTDLELIDGTIVITYCVYNPATNYEDDIIERYDFVLDREHED